MLNRLDIEKCKFCDRPAMWRIRSGSIRVCNDHKGDAYPPVDEDKMKEWYK